MITFETQDAFEAAVLKVISNKLNLEVSCNSSLDSYKEVWSMTGVDIYLLDNSGTVILSGSGNV